MKTKFRLSNLPGFEAIKAAYPNIPDDALLVRKGFTMQDMSIGQDDEMCSIGLISTPMVDRDGEIMDPDGCDLTYFKQNPVVMWAHDYSLPPIGACDEIKVMPNGIRAKTRYAASDTGKEIWQLVKDNFLRAASVGFITVERCWNDDKTFAAKLKDLALRTGQDIRDLAGVSCIITKWELIEYSLCPIPCNPQALMEAVSAKSINIGDKLLGALVKNAIPKIEIIPKMVLIPRANEEAIKAEALARAQGRI